MRMFYLVFLGIFIVALGLFIGNFAMAAAASNAQRSGLLELGKTAPDFKLRDVVTDRLMARDELAGRKGTLVMFICRHCPFVQHVKKELVNVARDYQLKGIGVIAISSNDAAEYKEDLPENLKAMALEEGFAFPFLYDETQSVAKSYTALMTPDIFLFDQSKKLVYRGQVDDSRPSNDKPVDGKDLRAAIDNLLAGKPALKYQKHAIGCSIKWKAGNQPSYAK